jgi:hypothetical protein
MHRIDSLDHVVVGGERRFANQNLPGTPGTVINAQWPNAIQEEVAHVIEAAGLTLAASGIADETAGWNQLKTAIFDSNALGSGALAAGAVGTSELAGKAVTAAKIADKTITSAQIANDAIGSNELQINAVNSGNITNSAVTESKIADGAISHYKIAPYMFSLINANTTKTEFTMKIMLGTLDTEYRVKVIECAWNGVYTAEFVGISVVGPILNSTGSAKLITFSPVSVSLPSQLADRRWITPCTTRTTSGIDERTTIARLLDTGDVMFYNSVHSGTLENGQTFEFHPFVIQARL